MATYASLSILDICFIIFYFLAVFGIAIGSAIWNRRRMKLREQQQQQAQMDGKSNDNTQQISKTEDYFLAGRHASWWAVGASLFSSNIGSEHFIGLASSGSQRGMSVGYFEWLAPFNLLLLGWIFVPRYMKEKIFTTPEFLEKRYNRTARTILALMSIVAYVFTKISVALYSGIIILNVILNWEDQWVSSVMIVVCTGIYTMIGGMTAVIYTEVLQTVVLVFGAFVLMGITLNEVGGLERLIQLEPDHFSMILPTTDPDYPWTGILFGFPVLSTWYWCADQTISQRALSAKDERTARSATVFAGYLKIIPVFTIVIPGIAARVIFPQETSENPNYAYPLLVARLLPTGLKGLLISSMLAALMSSLASVFNSCSTIFTMDFYQKFRPNASQNELVISGKIATLVISVLGILWIPILPYFSNQLWIYLQSVQTYFAPPILCVFIFGIFWKKATATAAVVTLIFGIIIGSIRFILELSFKGQNLSGFAAVFIGSNFLHFGAVEFVLCCLLLVVVTLIEIQVFKRRNQYARMNDESEISQERTSLSSLKENQQKEEPQLEGTKLQEGEQAIEKIPLVLTQQQKREKLIDKINVTAAVILCSAILSMIAVFH